MKQRFKSLMILILTITFMLTGCEEQKSAIEEQKSAIIEAVNTSSITGIVTIDGVTKTLTPSTSKMWVIKVNEKRKISAKATTTSGRLIYQGDIIIEKGETILYTFDNYGLLRNGQRIRN